MKFHIIRKPPTVRFKPRNELPERKLGLRDKIGLLLSLNRLFSGKGTTKDKTMINDIAVRYLAPIIRHGLTAAGGWLVAVGLPGPSGETITDLTNIATGAVVFGIGLLWSILEKKLRKA